MILNKRLALILTSLIIFTSIVFAVEDSNKIIPPYTFSIGGAGVVKTLLDDGGKYYLRTETFNTDGSYKTPSTEKQLSYKEYASIRASEDFKILKINTEFTVKNRYFYAEQVYNNKGKLLNIGSRVYEIVDGDNLIIEFNDVQDSRQILMKKEGSYFNVTKFLDENGNYTKDATYILINKRTFEEEVAKQSFDYQEIDEYFSDDAYSGGTMKSISYLDKQGDYIKRPFIISDTGLISLPEVKDKVANDKPLPTDKPTIPKPTTPSDGNNNNNGDSGSETDDSTTEDGNTIISDVDNSPSLESQTASWEDLFSLESIQQELEDNGKVETNVDLVNTDNKKDAVVDDTGKLIELGKDGLPKINDTGVKVDSKGNIVVEGKDGYFDKDGVFHPNPPKDQKGTYDKDGNFHPEGEDGYLDEQGNWHPGKKEDTKTQTVKGKVNSDGSITLPDGRVVKKDGTVINPDGTTTKGKVNPDGTITLPDGTIVNPDGTAIIPKKDNSSKTKDKNGNFVKEGTNEYIDEQGNVHKSTESTNQKQTPKGDLTIDENGNIQVVGENGVYYDEKGLAHLEDGRTGYYDKDGNFVEGKTNPTKDGFYDSNGKFHSEKETYQDSNKSTQIIKEPDLGLSIDKNDNIVVAGQEGYVDEKGLVHLPDGKVGYYDETGQFIESNNTPIKGGFYTKDGQFVDDSLYEKGSDGKMKISKGTFDATGTYKTPNGDKGYFDKDGVFHPNEQNPNKDGYYDENGEFHKFGETYVDENGNVRSIGKDDYVDNQGNLIDTKNVGGVIDKNGNLVTPDGTVVLEDGTIGYYDKDGKFVEGKNPYDGGRYDAEGNFIQDDGTVIDKNGKKGYYDKDGNFVEGENPNKDGFYDGEGNFHKKDGTIITKDGKIIDNTGALLENASIEKGKVNPDGSITLKDGTIIMKDGTIKNPDGTTSKGKVNPDGTITMPDGRIVNPDGTVVDPNSKSYKGKLNADGSITLPDGTIVMKDGTIKNPDGTLSAGKVNPDGSITLPDGTIVMKDGTVIGKNDADGYYDQSGNYHKKNDDGGYYDKNGNYITKDGKVGYYDKDGKFVEGNNPYMNGFYDKDGKWHGEGEPVKGYYDKDGNLKTGENPYNNGYYDANGNFHKIGDEGYMDKDGNYHKPSEDAIGSFDAEGNFKLNGDEGYYDKDGTYHTKDGKEGYYDKDGNFVEGKNPNKDGFYDAEGNWHKKGDKGYYDKNGEYHASVNPSDTFYYDKDGVLQKGTNPYVGGHYDDKGNWIPNDEKGFYDKEGNFHSEDGKIGYYDKNGKFVEGKNPYKDGYYDKNGKFTSFKDGKETQYFDADGNLKTGKNPYEGGYYDNQGNWHPDDEDGYYDKAGNFHTKDGKLGYYDADGKFKEGTNPYTDGYYDADGNFHMFNDKNGYYDAQGNYHTKDGKVGYFDENGKFIEGENPNEEGYYDKDGKFHKFGEGSLTVDEKYKFNKLFNYGTWLSPDTQRKYRAFKHTLQFSVKSNELNPRYLDTGIYAVPGELLTYEQITGLLHNIAIVTNNKFISDTTNSMLIYNGRIIPVNVQDKLTFDDLKSMFNDTNIDLRIFSTRIGKRVTLTESVERNIPIKIRIDKNIFNIKQPLMIINDQVMVSVEDIKDVIKFDLKKDGNNLTFTAIDAKETLLTKLSLEIGFLKGQKVENGNPDVVDINLLAPPSEIMVNNRPQLYIPIGLLPQLTDRIGYFDTTNNEIRFIKTEDAYSKEVLEWKKKEEEIKKEKEQNESENAFQNTTN